MPAYAGAFVMRDALLTLDETEFTNQISKARLVPDQPIQTMRTLVPDGNITDVDSAVWTLELTGVQDWETGGLAAFLHLHAGEIVEATLVPRKADTKKMATFNVRCIEPPFGGDQGAFAVVEMELPVQGAPVFGAYDATP
jgi:hypothetical protein